MWGSKQYCLIYVSIVFSISFAITERSVMGLYQIPRCISCSFFFGGGAWDLHDICLLCEA